jgi:hypothetical protein
LRFFESQVLLAVVEGNFHTPAHRIPSQNVFGCGIDDRRVKRSHAPATCQGFHSDDPQWSFGDREHPRLRIGNTCRCGAAINRQFDSAATFRQHLLGSGQFLAATTTATAVTGFGRLL